MKSINLIFLLDIITITVQGWPCVSQVRKVYSRVNTDAVLQFSADLTNLNSPRRFNVKFHDGTILATIRYNADRSYTTDALPGVSITGDAAGNVAVILESVQLSNAGIYTIDTAGFQLRCNCLYILGTPTKPLITLNKVPSVGESTTLTCSSTSTTTPSNHSLSIRYNWRVDNVDNPSGSRYSYSINRNTLTLSNIVKDDASKQFTCTATEDVTDGYTSSRSDSFSFDVYYGPENLDFSPSDTSYEIEENTNLNPVTCGASCYPTCTFEWTKIAQVGDVSNTAVLNLGTLTGSEAGTYRCTATRSGGSTQTKDLIVNVIYGPRNLLFHPDDTSYRRDENVDLPPITCSAECSDCSYRWTGPNSFSSSGPVLDIDGLQRSMAGQYTCTATNTKLTPRTQQSKEMQLEVRYGPESVTLKPGNVNYLIDEGSTLSNINCVSDCFPTCTYKWTKEGQTGAVSNTDTLPLGQIQKSYAGKYTCRATNGDTASRWFDKHVTINVRYGPYQSSTILSPTTQEYTRNEGSNLLAISCSADCYPDCSYTWTKTKQGETTTVSSTGILSLGTLDQYDAAIYTCTARNPVKITSPTTTKQVTVKVRYGPYQSSTQLSPTTQAYTRNEGTNLPDFSCSADCFPDCTYTWTKTRQGTTSTVCNTGILSLGTLDRDDAAIYTCTARNPGKTTSPTTTKQVTVKVRYGPYQSSTILSPTTQEYIRNEGTNLPAISCSADCYPDCAYTWTKTRQGKTTTVSSTEILSLGTLDQDDAAVYTCTAKNLGKSASPTTTKQATVKVRYGPDVANFNVQSPYYITEGETNINIECSSDCYPGCSYTWTNLTSGTRISTSNVLSLGKVNRYIAGDYKCISSNTAVQLTKISEAVVTTIVQYAPDVSIQLSTTQIIEGESLTLFCNGDGVPSTYTYSSLKQRLDNIEIPNSNKALSGTQHFSSIHFSSLKLEDTGTYTCALNNGVRNTSGFLNQIGSKSLLVEVIPKVLTEELRFSGSTGETLQIQISIYSYPSLKTATITRYDDNVLSSDQYNISEHEVTTMFYGKSVALNGSKINLMITDLKQEDFGSYNFNLTNRLDTTYVDVLVIAKCPPLKPKVFQYSFNYSIPTFIWQKDFNGGLVQSFIIQTSVAGTELWTNHTNISETDDQYKINGSFFMVNITGLQPGIYSARILAKNTEGESEIVHLDTTFEVFKLTDSTKKEHSLSTASVAAGISSAVVVVVVVVAAVGIFIWRKRKTKGHNRQEMTKSTHSQPSTHVPYENFQGVRETNLSQTYESLQMTNTEQSAYASLTAPAKTANTDSGAVYENLKLKK